MEKLGQKLPPLKKKKLSKKKEGEDKIKRKLTEANQEWCDWKFQIHWNKHEWVNPMSHNERKIYLVCLQKNCFKHNNKPAHWVVHSKLISLNIDEFFKITQKFDENRLV